jgi:hypothetical protein
MIGENAAGVKPPGWQGTSLNQTEKRRLENSWLSIPSFLIERRKQICTIVLYQSGKDPWPFM